MKTLSLLPLLLLATNFWAKPVMISPKAMYTMAVAKPDAARREETDEMIPWLPERKLLWDDFLCAPQKQGDAVASTSTSLGLSYQVKNSVLNFTITCNFSKHKSWGSLKTDYILAHEQAHFDITELHARKLYQALYTYDFSPATFKKDIARIYERIVKEKEGMQETYDSETDHSRKKKLQYDWLERINEMLKNTEAFAAYP